MPTRKDGSENTEKIIIRWSKSLRDRCYLAQQAGAHSSDAESTFIRYLIELGIAKYEKSILPLEQSQDESVVLDIPVSDQDNHDTNQDKNSKTGDIIMNGKSKRFFANTGTMYKDKSDD
jgi:hypothetical protein